MLDLLFEVCVTYTTSIVESKMF